jgi:UDP-2,4-diacetamido-2,4,6-trideoxy-beta-L-altropyranose hydrolase
MKILFRADSSSTIGTGHIMRDLVLVEQFPNDTIYFATQNLKGNINDKIIKNGYELINLKSNDVDELDIIIKNYNIDMIVIDHYRIDYKFEKTLKEKNPNLIIFSFDDTYEEHYCDILLNHNVYADKNKYKNLVPKKCEIRCGSKYTLLRREFKIEKTKSKFKNTSNKKKIFIAMGGVDSANLNIKILEVLKTFDHIQVEIVTTKANKNLANLEEYCKKKSKLGKLTYKYLQNSKFNE